jgi:hypothetical protein
MMTTTIRQGLLTIAACALGLGFTLQATAATKLSCPTAAQIKAANLSGEMYAAGYIHENQQVLWSADWMNGITIGLNAWEFAVYNIEATDEPDAINKAKLSLTSVIDSSLMTTRDHTGALWACHYFTTLAPHVIVNAWPLNESDNVSMNTAQRLHTKATYKPSFLLSAMHHQ